MCVSSTNRLTWLNTYSLSRSQTHWIDMPIGLYDSSMFNVHMDYNGFSIIMSCQWQYFVDEIWSCKHWHYSTCIRCHFRHFISHSFSFFFYRPSNKLPPLLPFFYVSRFFLLICVKHWHTHTHTYIYKLYLYGSWTMCIHIDSWWKKNSKQQQKMLWGNKIVIFNSWNMWCVWWINLFSKHPYSICFVCEYSEQCTPTTTTKNRAKRKTKKTTMMIEVGCVPI